MRLRALAILLGLAVGACREAPAPAGRDAVDAPTHEEYAAAIEALDLDRVALGRDWLAAADRALAQPIAVTLPFTETGYLPPAEAAAVGFRFDVRRGRRLSIEVKFESSPGGRLFVDLFELREEDEPRRVASLAAGQTTLEYDVRRDASHVLRLQPELLRGGRYTVSPRTLASIASPVRDFVPASVRSGFGAPRDGGAREHHGIDIFRPRGTPVIAAADGQARLDETPRGGRVIWLRDDRARRRLYYAHLDGWAISPGAYVRTGDVIGYVGNTGNARTTPPHLHFGVYDRGPADPLPFLAPDDALAAPPPTEVLSSLGRWQRVRTSRTTVTMVAGAAAPRTAALATIGPIPAPAATSARPPSRAWPVVSLPRGTVVRALAAVGDRVRVALPDGTIGLVRARDIAEATAPIRVAVARGAIRESPHAAAPIIDLLDREVAVSVFGSFGGFSLVQLPDARRGWMDVAGTE